MSERKEMAIAMLKDMPEEKISLKILLLIMTGNQRRQEKKNITVLVDTNVLLDYLTTRKPYFYDAYAILYVCRRKDKQDSCKRFSL